MKTTVNGQFASGDEKTLVEIARSCAISHMAISQLKAQDAIPKVAKRVPVGLRQPLRVL